GRFGDARAIQPLIQLMRTEFLASGGKLPDNEGESEDLRVIVNDLLRYGKDKGTGWQAMLAAGKLGEGRIVEYLIQALASEKSEAREQASAALGIIENRRATQPLIRL